LIFKGNGKGNIGYALASSAAGIIYAATDVKIGSIH
jgi:hypothetical protein